MTDLIGGQVQMMIEVMPNAYPQVEGGKLCGLAVTTARRWPTAPTIPTFAEAVWQTSSPKSSPGTSPAKSRWGKVARAFGATID